MSGHVDDARLVAYWADDLAPDDLAAVEEHLFACDRCLAEAERVARIARVLATATPPVISPEDLEELRARGLAIEENVFVAGERREVRFVPGVELMVHRLAGLDLAAAERVEVVIRSEAGGVMVEEPIAPFDRARGEVLIACQRHFAAFPRDVVFDVRVHRPGAAPSVSTYFVPHVFE